MLSPDVVQQLHNESYRLEPTSKAIAASPQGSWRSVLAKGGKLADGRTIEIRYLGYAMLVSVNEPEQWHEYGKVIHEIIKPIKPRKHPHMQKRNPDCIEVMMKQKRVRQWAARYDAQNPPQPDNVVTIDYVSARKLAQKTGLTSSTRRVA